MRLVQLTFTGQPNAGDEILISQVNNVRGGRSTAGTKVKATQVQTPVEGGFMTKVQVEPLSDTIATLLNNVNVPGAWTGDFEFKVNGNVVTVGYPHKTHDDITIVPQVNGTGTLEITLSEL